MSPSRLSNWCCEANKARLKFGPDTFCQSGRAVFCTKANRESLRTLCQIASQRSIDTIGLTGPVPTNRSSRHRFDFCSTHSHSGTSPGAKLRVTVPKGTRMNRARTSD